ncbi:TIR-like protein FxsC [Streptomyces sp. NBC_00876]|uniref:TIR-like protein FxsC n=1 Tax=Streptomyces sp. NBC_00876 TaxID=2975853 RepID=UPI0038696444|nr:TIR-like protein FxsC [Streptomyces sp. NBC_00876]
MPDRTGGLDAVVDTLLGLDRGLDAVAIAEILWLAAREDGPASGRGTPADGAGRQEDAQAGEPAAGQPAQPAEAARRSPLHTPWAEGSRTPGGTEVSLPRAGSLPRSRELARALKPLKRPWRRGRRQRLDIAATVDDYVRAGELTPVFSDEPERWFDATVVIDRSPTMRVWSDTADELVRLLARTGVFRTLRVRDLYVDGAAPALHGPLGQRVTEGGGRSAQPRRLMLVLSDWASAAWRDGAQWKQLRTWAVSMPTVLLNPLPPKIWRHAGMSLPAVRVVSPGTPGVHNARLRFTTTLLMEQAFPGTAGRDWLPVPVNALSPHAVGSWARTLMLSDPAGCEALLLPAPDLVDQLVEPEEEVPRSGHALTEAYLHRASPAAVRLAVLCSLYPQVSIDMLRAVRRSLVPEASSADLAEFVVGGLVTVTEAARDGGPLVLRFREGAREQLKPRLGARDARRLHSALDRFIGSGSASSAGRVPAAAAGRLPAAAIPVDPEPFGEVSASALRALGFVDGTAVPVDTASGAPAPGPGAGASVAPPEEEPTVVEEGSAVAGDEASEPSAPGALPGSPARPVRAQERLPYFFMSYAHTPGYGGGTDPDMWVERLFQDLSGHVMAMTDLPAGAPAGFLDREIRSGEGWSERLGEVLATCRVFVPLFSPRYFASEMCGKEWYAFEQRVIHHRARTNRPASAIVPALWVPVPPSQLPGPAERLQFNHSDFGERYVTDGLYGLIKLRLFAEEYERAVYELAKRIVRVADTAAITPGRPVDYRTAPSAFGPPGGGGASRPMKITIAAPARHDLPRERSADYYGDTPQDWNPYHPASARPLAQLAADIVRALNYQPVIAPFDWESAGEERAAQPSTPEILVLDRWVLRDEERRMRLAAYDTQDRPWVSVVVPWNREDPESRGAEAELTETLEMTMPARMRQGRTFSRAAAKGVPSLEAFGRILPQVVEAAAQQYLRHAATYPPTYPPTSVRADRSSFTASDGGDVWATEDGTP